MFQEDGVHTLSSRVAGGGRCVRALVLEGEKGQVRAWRGSRLCSTCSSAAAAWHGSGRHRALCARSQLIR